MIDVIKEYLVSIGFDVNANSFNQANKQLNKFEKALGEFADTIAGKFAISGAAVTTFSVIATAAIGKFATEVAKADQEVEIFARRMLTTERNARSLKSVMDAMGLKDLEALKDVNLNPELRAQFLSLRHLTQGLEPGEDIQKSLANVRQLGYEFQKFQVLASYAVQYIGGYLAKYLAKPLEDLKKAFGSFNERFAKNMEKWADRIAKLLAMVARMGIASAKLLALLDKVPDVIKQITLAVAGLSAIIMAGPWGEFLAAWTGILLLADDYFTYKQGGISALPGLWAGAETTFNLIATLLTNIDAAVTAIATKFLGNEWGQRAKNALYGAAARAG